MGGLEGGKMLYAVRPSSRSIERVECKEGEVLLYSEKGMHRIYPINEDIIRITYTEREDFSAEKKAGVLAEKSDTGISADEKENSIYVTSGNVMLKVSKETGSFEYYKNGELVLRERDEDSKILEEFQAYKVDVQQEAEIRKIKTADGEKTEVAKAVEIPDRMLYHTTIHFEWNDSKEALFGLGQNDEGVFDLSGNTVYVHQANRKIAVPMIVSTKGYGILMDTYSPFIFRNDSRESYIYTDADVELDYYFIAGKGPKDVVRGYRILTGEAVMLPRWAFGYMQSQERYETQEEIINVAKEYREREIGLDCIILDWCSWEDGKWGQKSFDKERFNDPAEMVQKLHDIDVHFMMSIWPNMDENTENYFEMREKDCLLPNSNIYNALEEGARRLYWKQVEKGLFAHGVDGWWCDSSEPITVEWEHREKMEQSILFAEYIKRLGKYIPSDKTNSFCLHHAQTIYENQRKACDEKRVCNLTRSAYTGQQRYGTILWSGDTAASWDTFRKQIIAGLNFSSSGLPYWTTDIGAFFVKKGQEWYWNGRYENTTEDMGYVELFTRWYQWGALLPVFRGHGTDCRRELWKFRHEEDTRFYDAMIKINRLRYKLMPYIYSQAGKVWLNGESMINSLAFEYPDDKGTYNICDQYMFGDSIMVCPVVTPMYYEENSEKLVDIDTTRSVYLPYGEWYDYWTKRRYTGGCYIKVAAPIDVIPLFVKAGSIIPVSAGINSVKECNDISWEVYDGADAEYVLYNDEGDGYAYENGGYTCERYTWNTKNKKLYNGNGEEVNDLYII